MEANKAIDIVQIWREKYSQDDLGHDEGENIASPAKKRVFSSRIEDFQVRWNTLESGQMIMVRHNINFAKNVRRGSARLLSKGSVEKALTI